MLLNITEGQQSNETPLFYFAPQRNQFQNKLKITEGEQQTDNC
jgi:hypothetical protein